MQPLPLRERNKQRIRAKILAVASDLFQTVGYSNTTMEDIAAQAHISRGTLFNYFPSKDALLSPFIQEMFQSRIRPALNVYLTEQPSTLRALRFLFLNMYEQLLKIPDIDQAFKQEFVRRKDIHSETYEPGELIKAVMSILEYGQKRGEVRTDASIEKLARYIGVLHVSIFFSMVMSMSSKPRNYEAETESLLAFIESGLTQRPQGS